MRNPAILLRLPQDWRDKLDKARGDNDLSWFLREIIADRIGRSGLSPNFTTGQGGGTPAHRKTTRKRPRKKVSEK